MKKTLMGVVCAMGVMTSGAWAGADFGLFGSYWNTKEFSDDGWGAGAKASIEIVKPLSLEVRGTYFDDLGAPGSERLQAIPVEAGLKLALITQQWFKAYVGGGGGYYFLDLNQGGSIDDEWGWYGVGGIEVMLSKHVGLFGEAIYRGLEGNVNSAEPLKSTEDVSESLTHSSTLNLDGWGANAGLIFK